MAAVKGKLPFEGRVAAPAISGKKQDTRFKPEQSGNPAGRPKGSRNNFTECLVELIAADCEAHAKEVIEKIRQIVSLLPKPRDERTAEWAIERLPDEELVRIIRETRELLAKAETDESEE